MNKNKWTAYKKLTKAKKTTYKNQFCKMIINDSKKNTFDISIKNPTSFNSLFAYINTNEKSLTDSIKHGYIERFFDGYNNLISINSYDDILERTIDSIDVYGLGFTLQYILNCFYRQNVIDLIFFEKLSTFFYKMYDFNPETREINIDNLIEEYENILLDTGILTRLNKSFENHIIVNKKVTRNAKIKNVLTKTRKHK
jgi:hypothetical protein